MGTIIDNLREYLATTPEEQLLKDWDSLKEWNSVGPTVDEYISSIEYLKTPMNKNILKNAGFYRANGFFYYRDEGLQLTFDLVHKEANCWVNGLQYTETHILTLGDFQNKIMPLIWKAKLENQAKRIVRTATIDTINQIKRDKLTTRQILELAADIESKQWSYQHIAEYMYNLGFNDGKNQNS